MRAPARTRPRTMADMAAMTDAQLLTIYNEALQAVALGQSYEIAGRSLTRANLAQIRETIEWLEARIERASASPATAGIGLASFNRQG